MNRYTIIYAALLSLILFGCADNNPYPNWDNAFDPANKINAPFLQSDTIVAISSPIILTTPDSIADKNVKRIWYISKDTTALSLIDTLTTSNADTTIIAQTTPGFYFYPVTLQHFSVETLRFKDTMNVTVMDTIPTLIFPLDTLQEGLLPEDKIGFYQARLRWERTYPDSLLVYRIRYGLSPTTLTDTLSNVTTNFHVLEGLSINTLYYWTVDAVFNIGGIDSIVSDTIIGNFKTTSPLGMVFVPGGSFEMGSDTIGEPEEAPKHNVTVSGFWMDTTEVTVSQYHFITDSDISILDTLCLNCPKTKVNWYSAIRYANEMSKRYGADTVYSYDNIEVIYVKPTSAEKFTHLVVHDSVAGFRLPTEAEWEYAARAATITNFYWGDDTTTAVVNQYTWFNSDSINPVGVLTPNTFGLYDMLGNVWEWVQDTYDSTAYQNQDGAINPTGPQYNDSLGVVRGCSWSENKSSSCTVFERRLANKILESKDFTGFRLVFNIPD
ncbi:MAG: formylglycine-generating enzyme family protein [Fibrobacterales bacterium]